MTLKKVVVVGGGFGGMNVVLSLRRAPVDILLIDKTNHHLFQPLLYEVATASLSPGQIATPLREILRDQNNATLLMAEVISIDKEARTLTLSTGDLVHYDILVLATGARHSYFGNQAWESFAPGLKTLEDAIKIREQILLSFEKAERLSRLKGMFPPLNFVIIGGGPTGVEMAGAIAEIANKTLARNFRHIHPEKSQVFLVEALPQILPMFPAKLAQAAVTMLEALGVTVLTSKKVTSIDANGVQIEDQFIASENVIWAAGNQVSPLLKTLNLPLDRAGRVMVKPDLSVEGYPDLFVIGDAACLIGKDGKPLPGVAPVAMQEGRYVAKLIMRGKSPDKRSPFSYFDKGSMATIGKAKAIVLFGKFQLSGFFAWLIWAFVHILFLIGFRNRIGVMFEWATALLTKDRGVRLITKPASKEPRT